MRSVTRIAFTLTICLFAACKESKLTHQQPDAPSFDPSLTISEYVAMGMPPIDRPWTEDDQVIAAECIKKISEEKPNCLPRFNSPKSGRLFERLIDTDLLFQLKNDEVSVEARIAIATKGFDAIADSSVCYAKLSNLPYAKETFRLFGAFLRSAAMTAEFCERMSQTLKKEDRLQLDMERMSKRRLDGLPSALGRVLDIFGNRREGDPENLLDFISIASDRFAQLFSRLTRKAKANH